MNTKIWSLPRASVITQGPLYTVRMHRQCEISFAAERVDGSAERFTLRFDGVEAFKATYLNSLGSIDTQWLKEAYCTVISVPSEWLSRVERAYTDYLRAAHRLPQKLQHLVICFDDGPCYEFVCVRFEQESKTEERTQTRS